MLDAHAVYEIAKKYQAEITERRQIKWLVTENLPGRWVMQRGVLPSVLDAVILEKSWRVHPYLAAVQAATMWSRPRVMGFLQGMYLGKPPKSEAIKLEEFQYWKGMLGAMMVIQKLKSRQAQAEALFS